MVEDIFEHTLNRIALHSSGIHDVTSLSFSSHDITRHYTTLRDITCHYITYIHVHESRYVYIYIIYVCVCHVQKYAIISHKDIYIYNIRVCNYVLYICVCVSGRMFYQYYIIVIHLESMHIIIWTPFFGPVEQCSWDAVQHSVAPERLGLRIFSRKAAPVVPVPVCHIMRFDH